MAQTKQNVDPRVVTNTDTNNPAANNTVKNLASNSAPDVNVPTSTRNSADAPAAQTKQNFDQRVIVNTDTSDPAVNKAVQNLANKHPDNSVVIAPNADGSHTIVQGTLANGGSTKVEVVGHGKNQAVGGLDSKQITDVVKNLASDGKTQVDKVALVGCGTACAKDGNSLVTDVSNLLAQQGATTEVKGYETGVKVNEQGRKTPAADGDRDALGKTDATPADATNVDMASNRNVVEQNLIWKMQERGHISYETADFLSHLKNKAAAQLESGPVFLGEDHYNPNAHLVTAQLIGENAVKRLLLEFPPLAALDTFGKLTRFDSSFKEKGYSSADDYLSRVPASDAGSVLHRQVHDAVMGLQVGDYNPMPDLMPTPIISIAMQSGVNVDLIDSKNSLEDSKKGSLSERNNAMANQIKSDPKYSAPGVLAIFGFAHVSTLFGDTAQVLPAMQQLVQLPQERVMQTNPLFKDFQTGELGYPWRDVAGTRDTPIMSDGHPYKAKVVNGQPALIDGQPVYTVPAIARRVIINAVGDKAAAELQRAVSKNPQGTTVFDVQKNGSITYVSGGGGFYDHTTDHEVKAYILSDSGPAQISNRSLLMRARSKMEPVKFEFITKSISLNDQGQVVKVRSSDASNKDGVTQHVVLNTEPNNIAAKNAVRNLRNKHENGIVFNSDGAGGYELQGGYLIPQGTIKLDVVGHGITDENGTRLGGFTASQISDLALKIAADNDIEIKKLNLVGCGTTCPQAGAMDKQVNKQLLEGGSNTTVKGYPTAIVVDANGHKYPVPDGTPNALGKDDPLQPDTFKQNERLSSDGTQIQVEPTNPKRRWLTQALAEQQLTETVTQPPLARNLEQGSIAGEVQQLARPRKQVVDPEWKGALWDWAQTAPDRSNSQAARAYLVDKGIRAPDSLADSLRSPAFWMKGKVRDAADSYLNMSMSERAATSMRKVAKLHEVSYATLSETLSRYKTEQVQNKSQVALSEVLGPVSSTSGLHGAAFHDRTTRAQDINDVRKASDNSPVDVGKAIDNVAPPMIRRDGDEHTRQASVVTSEPNYPPTVRATQTSTLREAPASEWKSMLWEWGNTAPDRKNISAARAHLVKEGIQAPRQLAGLLKSPAFWQKGKVRNAANSYLNMSTSERAATSMSKVAKLHGVSLATLSTVLSKYKFEQGKNKSQVALSEVPVDVGRAIDSVAPPVIRRDRDERTGQASVATSEPNYPRTEPATQPSRLPKAPESEWRSELWEWAKTAPDRNDDRAARAHLVSAGVRFHSKIAINMRRPSFWEGAKLLNAVDKYLKMPEFERAATSYLEFARLHDVSDKAMLKGINKKLDEQRKNEGQFAPGVVSGSERSIKGQAGSALRDQTTSAQGVGDVGKAQDSSLVDVDMTVDINAPPIIRLDRDEHARQASVARSEPNYPRTEPATQPSPLPKESGPEWRSELWEWAKTAPDRNDVRAARAHLVSTGVKFHSSISAEMRRPSFWEGAKVLNAVDKYLKMSVPERAAISYHEFARLHDVTYSALIRGLAKKLPKQKPSEGQFAPGVVSGSERSIEGQAESALHDQTTSGKSVGDVGKAQDNSLVDVDMTVDINAPPIIRLDLDEEDSVSGVATNAPDFFLPWIKPEPSTSPEPASERPTTPIMMDAPVKEEVPVIRHAIDNRVPVLQGANGEDILLAALQPPQLSKRTDNLFELIDRQKITGGFDFSTTIADTLSSQGVPPAQQRLAIKRAKLDMTEQAQALLKMSGEQRAAYLESWLAVDEVPGKGRGVMAARDIPAFQVLSPYAGKLVVGEAAMAAEQLKIGKQNFSAYAFGTKSDNALVSAFGDGIGNISSLINEGDQAADNNVSVIRLGTKIVFFVAKQPIKAGEQLLYDYGGTYDRSGWPSHPVELTSSDSSDESATESDQDSRRVARSAQTLAASRDQRDEAPSPKRARLSDEGRAIEQPMDVDTEQSGRLPDTSPAPQPSTSFETKGLPRL
ncbi:C80 family cysteine peptidase [Pseudomonas turukhanskensis]|uniref:C80 family cysteine peptidase n=1 Tax=Pseudomonas turukhanskensis TaxID=1806536 RepID=UPI0022F33CA1|nr:C80 family cysteine peptidase [Pseudomonas turukhanskensis]